MYEDKGPNNTWSLRSRSQKVTTGHTKIQAGENYDGKSWKNGFLQTILSDAAGRDTFYRYQEWGSAGWGAEIQARITYDECGQEIRRETYEVRFDGPRLTEQYRSEYDAAGHLVREIYLRKMGNDADRMDESIWRYGADDQLDTFQRYRYIDGHRENELLDAYAHFDKDSIVRQIFKWVDFSWQLQAKEVIFPSPRRYGLAPDSRLFYMLRSDSTFGLVMRTTYDLRELERNRLYLRKEEWQFHEETRQWNLDQLEETWYRVRDK